MQELLQRIEDSGEEIDKLKENMEVLEFSVEQFMAVKPALSDEVNTNPFFDDSSREQEVVSSASYNVSLDNMSD